MWDGNPKTGRCWAAPLKKLIWSISRRAFGENYNGVFGAPRPPKACERPLIDDKGHGGMERCMEVWSVACSRIRPCKALTVHPCAQEFLQLSVKVGFS